MFDVKETAEVVDVGLMGDKSPVNFNDCFVFCKMTLYTSLRLLFLQELQLKICCWNQKPAVNIEY